MDNQDDNINIYDQDMFSNLMQNGPEKTSVLCSSVFQQLGAELRVGVFQMMEAW